MKQRRGVQAREGIATGLFFLLALSLSACDDDGSATSSREALFEPTVTEIALEIDYEADAEPFVQGALGPDPWGLSRANLDALFEGSGKTVTFPTTLDGMQALGAIEGEDHDVNAILAIADANWTDRGDSTRKVFYVVFLDGFFADEDGRRDTVLGVSIGDTGVIAMFKPVIEGGGGLVANFVEQTTLIHEFGHAVGLVNNGVALTAEHHDSEHGAHCTNDRCVMYYLNEGAGDLREFVSQFVIENDTVVFDQDCLNDVRAAISAGQE